MCVDEQKAESLLDIEIDIIEISWYIHINSWRIAQNSRCLR